MLKKILRINRRIAHRSYQFVFPIGVVVIAICGIIITETDDKVLDWSIDFSSMPTLLGYVFLWGALLAIASVFIEAARKAFNAVYGKFKCRESLSLQQRIDKESTDAVL